MKATAVFFVFMLCFTILSRAADQMGIAVVKVERPQNMVIGHSVRATGRIVQNQELAVTTEPDQRVTAIHVSEGQRVSKGDLLFELDTTLLDEKILYQKQELEKQELNVADAKSQKDISKRQKENEQAQAAEQYSLSTQSAGVQLSRAEKQLSDAQKELKEFRKKSGNLQTDDSVEAALEQALVEKSNAYIAAQQELTSLEWKIENAVNAALQAAQNGATLSKTQIPRTQASEEFFVLEETEEDLCAEEKEKPENASFGSGSDADTSGDMSGEIVMGIKNVLFDKNGNVGKVTFGSTGAQNSVPEISIDSVEEVGSSAPSSGEGSGNSEHISDGISGDTAGDLFHDGSDMNTGTTGDGMSGQISGDVSDINTGTVPGGFDQVPDTESDGTSGSISGNVPGTSGLPSGSGGNGNSGDSSVIFPEDSFGDSSGQGVTQEELAQIEASVRNSYREALAAAQRKVEDARAEKEAAEAALMAYQQERMTAANADEAAAERQLIANVQAAQQAYEDAAIAANQAAVTSGRAVAAAGIPNASNSSDRLNEITYEQMELSLKKLEKLKKENGKVYADTDGLIMKIQIQTGEKTSDTTAVLMADLTKGYRFTAEITKEQEKYIGTGDLVTLSGGNGKLKLEELAVESVTVDEADADIYHVIVQIPENTFEIGMTAAMDFVKKSQAYPVTVPLSALHLDDKNQAYVLVPEEYDSIMGIETKARKVSVTVQEKNESYAALADGILGSDQKVITSSDKAVDDGSRIRIEG
ncbi:biotin/lipoyl-binding protein [bacterium 1XD42-54]|nr:biotin/lipoyl-binding protein [bacterium 1XD42-54]